MGPKRATLLPLERPCRRLCGGLVVFLRLGLLMVFTSCSCDRPSIRDRAKADRDNGVIDRARGVAVRGTHVDAEGSLLATPDGYDSDSEVPRSVARRGPAQLEDASMDRIVGGVQVLVLGMAVVVAEAEGQDRQPATPEQQYQVLLKEYNDAFQEYAKAYGEAKTPEEQQQVVRAKYPWPAKCASKFLALAEKRP